MMKKVKFSPLGRNVFLTSFLSGTLLLITYLITQANIVAVIGFYFVIAAFVTNMLVLLYELLEFLIDVSDKKASGNAVLLLLVNIPVVILYLFIIFKYLNPSIIKFYS